MSQNHDGERAARTGPWVIDTRDFGRRAGASRRYTRRPPAPAGFGLDMVRVPEGEPIELDLLLEAVVEGVLVSGTARASLTGECARCLDPVSDEVEVEFRELFAYPESATDTSTDEDEVSRVEDDLIDLEPLVRDTVLTSLSPAPLCSPDCQGLCAGCGVKWAELDPQHHHETMDPRWAALRERFGRIEEEN
ncbi:YceD family protein [Haloactinomyces albus]